MSNHNYERRTITMTPEHWEAVQGFATDYGYPSLSAALRRVIDEWLQLRSDAEDHIFISRMITTAEPQ